MPRRKKVTAPKPEEKVETPVPEEVAPPAEEAPTDPTPEVDESSPSPQVEDEDGPSTDSSPAESKEVRQVAPRFEVDGPRMKLFEAHQATEADCSRDELMLVLSCCSDQEAETLRQAAAFPTDRWSVRPALSVLHRLPDRLHECNDEESGRIVGALRGLLGI